MLSRVTSLRRILTIGAAALLLVVATAIDFDSAFAGKKNKGGGGGGGGGQAQKMKPQGGNKAQAKQNKKQHQGQNKGQGKGQGKSQAKQNRGKAERHGKDQAINRKQDRPKGEAKRQGNDNDQAAGKHQGDGGKNKEAGKQHKGGGGGDGMSIRDKMRDLAKQQDDKQDKEKDNDAKGGIAPGLAKEPDGGKQNGDDTKGDNGGGFQGLAKPPENNKQDDAKGGQGDGKGGIGDGVPGLAKQPDGGKKDGAGGKAPGLAADPVGGKGKDHGKGEGAPGLVAQPPRGKTGHGGGMGGPGLVGNPVGPGTRPGRPPKPGGHGGGVAEGCPPPLVFSHRARTCVRPAGPQVATCIWPRVRVAHGCVCAPGFLPSGGSCIKPPAIVPVGPVPGGPPQMRPLPEPPILQPRPGMPPGPAFTPRPEAIAANADPYCLPDDLYDLMEETYGRRPGIGRCPVACLPKPIYFSAEELDAVAAKGGIEWCENCLQVGSYMPLASIRLLERVGNVKICVNPDMCRLPAGMGGGDYGEREVEIRTIYKELPKGIDNGGNIAVVVGNRDYEGELPLNEDGKSSADAVVELLTEQLGYNKDNIIDLRNATLADMQRVFGTDDNPGGEIGKRIDQKNPGHLFVYVASHGLADEADENRAYVLPIDAKLGELDGSAYPLQDLYKALGRTGADTTMLMLEANFAKNLDELIDAPNLPGLEIEAMPAEAVPGLVVLKASDRDQKTIQDPEYGIGLFTRYLIEGLAGRADEAPIGNDDKRIDTVELYVYTADAVRTAARKSFGLEQKPLLSKIDNLVVGKLVSN